MSLEYSVGWKKCGADPAMFLHMDVYSLTPGGLVLESGKSCPQGLVLNGRKLSNEIQIRELGLAMICPKEHGLGAWRRM